MNRRSFVGLLGAVGIGGPKAVTKLAAPSTIEALSLAGISAGHDGPVQGMGGNHRDYAADILKKMAIPGTYKHDVEMSRHWIGGLDANTASLRSVALGRKIEISRRVQYLRQQRNQRTWYQGVFDRLWE